MTGYIANRKRLVEARVAALAMGRESGFAKAHADVVSFDEACQPQVESLVEAVRSWQRARGGLELSDATRRLDAAAIALDARADEVAGKE